MSLTKVSYSMINGDMVNVLDYGVVGNGVADDTTALQAAIDAAATAGKTLWWPIGTYKITATLNIKNKKISWVGENYYTNSAEIIGSFDGFLVDGSGVSPSTYYGPYEISNLKFTNSNNGTALGSCGCLNLAYTGTCKIINCAIVAQGTAVQLNETISATFTDNYVQGDSGTNPNRSYNRGYYGQGRNTRINGGRIYGCYIAADISGDSWVISQCNTEFNDIIFRTSALSSMLVEGCHIETSGMLWTNAVNLPTITTTPWTDNMGDGIGWSGSIKFLNCIVFFGALGTTNGVRAPIFVCKTQAGFGGSLDLSGNSFAVGSSMATLSNSFSYSAPTDMISGLKFFSSGNTGFIDPNNIPQDQYTNYIRFDTSNGANLSAKFTNIRLLDSSNTITQITDGMRVSGYVYNDLYSTFYNRSVINSGLDFSPSANNTFSLGKAGNRWTEVFAVNGVINTSDKNAKTEIEDTSLGLNFINLLQPKQYKMKQSGRWTDGELVDMVDENGHVVIDSDGKTIKVIKQGSQQPIPGQRFHQGLIAQEVKAVLDQLGIDSAMWINGENNIQGLRYEELIAPLIKAVQELSAKVVALETK